MHGDLYAYVEGPGAEGPGEGHAAVSKGQRRTELDEQGEDRERSE